MSFELAPAAALAALTLILVQIALHLPLGAALGAITGPTLRSVAVMRARGVSDHWKERAMMLYARRTFGGVFRFLAQLGLLAGVAVGIGAGIAYAMPGFVEYSLGVQGLVLTLVVATLWLVVAGRLVPRAATPVSDYTAMEQLMHRVALGNAGVAEMAFAIDQMATRLDAKAAAEGEHVFVAGLARAGTTVLTRALHESGAFGSLTYRDMPFVLAPGLWRKLAGKRGGVSAGERAHGDGVIVDTDSPESLEEPFWRVFDGSAYLKADHLRVHAPEAGLVAKYRRYVASILKSRKATRYLAKNNNNILRLPMLAEAFPKAHLLVPFRDPVAHAGSLLAQHERFLESHAKDPFSRDYMGWLGHHEFGSDHRVFAVGARPEGDARGREYWLQEWCSVYGWLLETAPARARFVCYEDLCNDPATWDGLAAELGVTGAAAEFRPVAEPGRDGLSPLEERAYAIYDRLRARS